MQRFRLGYFSFKGITYFKCFLIKTFFFFWSLNQNTRHAKYGAKATFHENITKLEHGNEKTCVALKKDIHIQVISKVFP